VQTDWRDHELEAALAVSSAGGDQIAPSEQIGPYRALVWAQRRKGKLMRKRFIALMFAGIMCAGSGLAAEVFVSIAPPRVIFERRGPAPGREYRWINGYHRWDGNAYRWEAGRWERPPRPNARWEQHRWEHRRGGYVFVEGHWR